MTLEENKKKWKKYGLNSIKELKILHIEDLIIHKGNKNFGIKATYSDILEGKKSSSKKPLEVIWIMEENKFLLIDGYHRLVEALFNNKKTFLCNVDWKGFTLLWDLPLKKDRFNYSIDNLEDL